MCRELRENKHARESDANKRTQCTRETLSANMRRRRPNAHANEAKQN